MKPISGRTFAKVVERRGWQLLRINGSHHIHGNADLKLGLQGNLMKLAKIEESEI